MNSRAQQAFRLPPVNEIYTLLRELKGQIEDEYRASIQEEDETLPMMDLTIGWTPNDGTWSYQTGDNSFAGGAYLHPIWAVDYLTRRTNCRDMAAELISQLLEQTR